MQRKKMFVMEHSAAGSNMVFEDLDTLAATAVKTFGPFTGESKNRLRQVGEMGKAPGTAGIVLTCVKPDGTRVSMTVFEADVITK